MQGGYGGGPGGWGQGGAGQGGYGAPGGYGQPPGQAPAPAPAQMQPSAMGAQPYNPYARAQGALSGASSQLKGLKYVLAVFGVLMALGGVALVFTVGVTDGVSLGVSGLVVLVVAFTVLPRFSGMVGSATAQVAGLAYKAQLAQTGLPAAGRLLSVQQTGRMVNMNPEVMVAVEVTHPQMGTYQAQTTAVVPQIAIPRIQPGAQVEVRINPQNPQDVALVV